LTANKPGTQPMTRLASVLKARDVSPRGVPLSAFPASTVAAVRPYATPDGFLEVPSVERAETAWRYRVPQWFHGVPGKPACSWKRPDGSVLPRYPELIVRDLLVQRGGWNAAWAKNFGGRAFWVNLDRGGPELASMSNQARDLIQLVDEAVWASVVADGLRQRGGPPGGCWDVFAWRRGPKFLFLESKAPNEAFKDSQLRWIACALAVGVPFESFAVVHHLVP
jgi:hypothetical protein